jgi:alanine racemase
MRGALQIDLDLEALRRNVERVLARVPPGTQLICSVKANGYGHGVVQIGRALELVGVDALATASVPDALALREAGIRTRVLLFGGQLPDELPALAARGLVVTVANLEGAQAVAADPRNVRSVFVEVDCGLGRLGVPVAEVDPVLRGTLLPAGIAVAGIYTHLPFADVAGARWAAAGLERFRALTEGLERAGLRIPVIQALSSIGIAAGLPLSGNAVCPGRVLYGLLPAMGGAASWGLEPVLRSVTTRLVHVRRHERDRDVTSGGGHLVTAGDVTAVVPFGRAAGNLADAIKQPAVLHRGRRVRVAAVSLEHAVLDIGPFPAAIGDVVTIVGGDGAESVSLAELARWSDSSELDALVEFGRCP